MNIELFLSFIKKAGNIAMKNQKEFSEQSVSYKSEYITDMITKTDTEISNKFLKFIKANFKHVSYVIIDEENLPDADFDIFNQTDYQFVLDPIDGTLTYAYGIPMFAISLGILKKGKPYMGIVYNPQTKELVYCDSKEVYFVKNAFSKKEQKIKLKKESSQSPFIYKNARTLDLRQDADVKGNLELNLWSCVLHHLYLLTGRGKAAFVSAMFWDVAGTWAAFEKLGFNIYNTKTGKIMKDVSLDYFNLDYRFNAPHLICKPEDYDEIMGLIK